MNIGFYTLTTGQYATLTSADYASLPTFPINIQGFFHTVRAAIYLPNAVRAQVQTDERAGEIVGAAPAAAEVSA